MQKSFGVAKVLTLVLGLSALATVPVHADTISYQNALVTLNVTSNNYVTVTITNTLSNSQVTSVGSNISGLYFDVTGYTGSGAALSSSSGQTTDIYGQNEALSFDLAFLQLLGDPVDNGDYPAKVKVTTTTGVTAVLPVEITSEFTYSASAFVPGALSAWSTSRTYVLLANAIVP